MIHLLTTQGAYAKNYQLPMESIGNFKTIIRSITGGNAFIISNKFKTDIFYESSNNEHLNIIKLWMMYLRRTVKLSDIKQIHTFSGDEESLVKYFNSLSLFSRNKLRFKIYLQTFRRAFQSDPKNNLARKVIECDRHVVTQHQNKGLFGRRTLIEPQKNSPSFCIEKGAWKSIKMKMSRFEN